ncbi:MAG: ParB/RepB/Spo0J family partition protein [Pseudomonadota bacterium]
MSEALAIEPAEKILKTVALSALSVSDNNVRTQAISDRQMAVLEASIRAEGIMTPLLVRESAEGQFSVVDGGQRLAIAQVLASDGTWKGDPQIPVRVLNHGDDTSQSMAGNIHAPMHPADEALAFRAMIENEGADREDIAARFGVPLRVVNQRLAIASVDPKVLDLYRAGKMDLDVVRALTNAPQKRQMAVYKAAAKDWPVVNKLAIEHILDDDIVRGNEPVSLLVDERYREAGGEIQEDLFSDQADRQRIYRDAELVHKLAAEALEQRLEKLRSEGFGVVRGTVDQHEVYKLREGLQERDRYTKPKTVEERAANAALVRLEDNGRLVVDYGYYATAKAAAKDEQEAKSKESKAKAPPPTQAPATQDLTQALRTDLGFDRSTVLKVALFDAAMRGDESSNVLLDLLTFELAVDRFGTGDSTARPGLALTQAYTRHAQFSKSQREQPLLLDKRNAQIDQLPLQWLKHKGWERWMNFQAIDAKGKWALLCYCLTEYLVCAMPNDSDDSMAFEAAIDGAELPLAEYVHIGQLDYFPRLSVNGLIGAAVELMGDEKAKDLPPKKGDKALALLHHVQSEDATWLPPGF